MNQWHCKYAKEPWEGLEVARASETGHFIKGKAGRKLNTLATLILGPFHVQWIFSMDYVRDGEIQGRSLVFLEVHCPCILPSLT